MNKCSSFYNASITLSSETIDRINVEFPGQVTLLFVQSLKEKHFIDKMNSLVSKMVNLKTLIIYDCGEKTHEIIEMIPNLSKVTYLATEMSDKDKIARNSRFPPELKTLNLTEFPSKLQTLKIIGYDIEEIIDEFMCFDDMKILYLDDNNIKSFPSKIVKAQHLTDLDIKNNAVASLPKEIGNVSSLVFFNAQNNEIKELPSSFSELQNLEHVNLSANPLKKVPTEIEKLSNLKILKLRNTSIQKLPNFIGKLSHLKHLDVSHNNLKSLPNSIGKLSHLEHLDVSHNRLNSLPKSIGKLKALVVLKIIEFEKNPNRIIAPKNRSIEKLGGFTY